MNQAARRGMLQEGMYGQTSSVSTNKVIDQGMSPKQTRKILRNAEDLLKKDKNLSGLTSKNITNIYSEFGTRQSNFIDPIGHLGFQPRKLGVPKINVQRPAPTPLSETSSVIQPPPRSFSGWEFHGIDRSIEPNPSRFKPQPVTRDMIKSRAELISKTRDLGSPDANWIGAEIELNREARKASKRAYKEVVKTQKEFNLLSPEEKAMNRAVRKGKVSQDVVNARGTSTSTGSYGDWYRKTNTEQVQSASNRAFEAKSKFDFARKQFINARGSNIGSFDRKLFTNQKEARKAYENAFNYLKKMTDGDSEAASKLMSNSTSAQNLAKAKAALPKKLVSGGGVEGLSKAGKVGLAIAGLAAIGIGAGMFMSRGNGSRENGPPQRQSLQHLNGYGRMNA